MESRRSENAKEDGDNQWYNPIRFINLMVSEPYYLFNFLVFFSYIPVRCSASQVISPHFSSHLLYREIQALLTFCLLAVVKIVRDETWEAFISDTLSFAKIFLVAVALFMDYHLAFWYTSVFIVMYILTQQPSHQGSGTSNKLTPLQLESLLTEGNTSRFWLVEFCALSSSTCIRTSSFFPELSITYSNKNLSFGIVDLGLFPNAAEKFGISLGSLNQLPVYILFENAVEVARFPEVDLETKVFSPSITKVCIRGNKKTMEGKDLGCIWLVLSSLSLSFFFFLLFSENRNTKKQGKKNYFCSDPRNFCCLVSWYLFVD